MPDTPLRPCAEPGCPARVPYGRCPTHARVQDKSRPNVDQRRLYRTARWRRLRQQVLTDMDALCHECYTEGRVEPATDVHHKTKPQGNVELFFERSNLQGLCRRHHSAHTGRGE
jgi:5-methylcytosine-specific restriction protein A